MSDAEDLSGTWHGIFNYSDGHRPNVFTMRLQDIAGILTGETTEPSDDAEDHAETLHAWIQGRHQGSSAAFVKSYDDPARAGYVVHYQGTVTSDGSEVSGAWNIADLARGTFIMIRHDGATNEAAKTTAERVR